MTISPQLLRELRDALDEEWITADEWCRRTGDTLEAIYSRRAKGTWQDGVHSNKPKGGGLWVNRVKANEWAAKSVSRLGSMRASAGPAPASESPSSTAARIAGNG